jgi:hypothetical protein
MALPCSENQMRGHKYLYVTVQSTKRAAVLRYVFKMNTRPTLLRSMGAAERAERVGTSYKIDIEKARGDWYKSIGQGMGCLNVKAQLGQQFVDWGSLTGRTEDNRELQDRWRATLLS